VIETNDLAVLEGSYMEVTMRTQKRVLSTMFAAALLAACSETADVAAPGIVAPPHFDVVFESAGPPFYAVSGNGGFIPHTETWAALPFQRRLSCVPAEANLLESDFSAFGCQATVQGHEHWENGPPVDPAPRQTVFRGLGAVPVIFAPWPDLQAAIADEELTLTELLQLPQVRIGSAHTYQETDILGISGPLGAGRGMYKINARGTLLSGGSFRLHVNEVLGEQRVVQITFE
jgi:hypothetical protein